MLEKGLVQIYTGNGKGKTTAAIGLALRAASHGHRVLFYQFLKPPSLEITVRFAPLLEAAGIHFEALDQPWDMSCSLDRPGDVAQVREAITLAVSKLAEAASRRDYDVIILDEIIFCLSRGLADAAVVRDLIETRDGRVEIVLTGRGADTELLNMADLATEMKNIRHPFDSGQAARSGIEY